MEGNVLPLPTRNRQLPVVLLPFDAVLGVFPLLFAESFLGQSGLQMFAYKGVGSGRDVDGCIDSERLVVGIALEGVFEPARRVVHSIEILRNVRCASEIC